MLKIIIILSFIIPVPVMADINSDLIAAAKKGNLPQVTALIEQGADVNAKDDRYGRTPLMWASIKGKTSVVEELLDKGTDVNIKDKSGQFAAKFAALYQNHDILDLLNSYGVGNSWQAKRIIKKMETTHKRANIENNSTQVKAAKKKRKGTTGALNTLNAPSKGPDNAPVIIIEYTDYQCPVCKLVQPRIDKVLSKYRGKIKLFVMNNPLGFHKKALSAAMAARAAAQQGKFWEMHRLLYENNKKLTEKNFKDLAWELRLDINRFNYDRKDKKLLAEIMQEQRQAVSFGATGTPTFFINGMKFVGAPSVKKFEKIIEKELTRAGPGAI